VAIEPLPSQRNTVHPLASSLERLQRSMGLARPDSLRVLEDAWPSLVGARLAGACRLESLRDGCMTVSVADPAVADHLRWVSSDLAAAANEVCGGEVVTQVRTKVRRRAGDDASSQVVDGTPHQGT
jgi:predicted nucleic acid-binding Zn ribbon protein